MQDFILFMHTDTTTPVPDDLWEPWFERLRAAQAFQGGSAIGAGEVLRKDLPAACLTSGIDGYVRIRAPDLPAARALIRGNPVYECGGSVEIRELPRE